MLNPKPSVALLGQNGTSRYLARHRRFQLAPGPGNLQVRLRERTNDNTTYKSPPMQKPTAWQGDGCRVFGSLAKHRRLPGQRNSWGS